MALVLGLIGLVPAVALAAPSDISTWHGVLGAAGFFYGWTYSRAEVWGLWAIRVTLALLAVPAIIRSPVAGAVFLSLYVAALVILSWTKEAMLAVRPLMENLPGPRVLEEKQGG